MTLIQLADVAEIRVMRNDQASALSNPKSATETRRFHTDFTQNDGQLLLASRPYTKQLTHQY
jgi:phage I-like protein